MKVRASLVGLWAIIVSSTVLSPLLGPNAQYLLALHFALSLVVLLRPMPGLSPIHILIAANVFALAAHIGDMKSVLNAGGLIASVIAIAGVAYAFARTWKIGLPEKIERCLWWCLAVSVVLSVALTAVGWPTAPEHFPWEAFVSEERLLLLRGEGGHTPSLWLTAFLMAFVMYRKGSLWIVGLLTLALIATKSRLALVYVVNIALMAAAYWRVPLARPAVLVAPIVFAVAFLVFSITPPHALNDLATKAQTAVGDAVRVTPEHVSVFAGRDLLNKALWAASFEHPLIGSGNSASILQFGVDREGIIAASIEEKAASSESVLRLAVKYGWLYFAALATFLLSVPLAFRTLPYRDRVLALTVWGMCLESIVAEGGLDSFHGVSALLLFLICAFHFMARTMSVQKLQ